MSSGVGGPTEQPSFRAVPTPPEEAKTVQKAAQPKPMGRTEAEFTAQKGAPASDAKAAAASQIAQKAMAKGWLKA